MISKIYTEYLHTVEKLPEKLLQNSTSELGKKINLFPRSQTFKQSHSFLLPT